MPAESHDLPPLSPENNAILSAILESSESLFTIAAYHNLTLAALLQRVQSPAFQANLDAARRLALKRADAHLAEAAQIATTTLASIARDPDADPTERRRAATTILGARRPRRPGRHRRPDRPHHPPPRPDQGDARSPLAKPPGAQPIESALGQEPSPEADEAGLCPAADIPPATKRPRARDGDAGHATRAPGAAHPASTPAPTEASPADHPTPRAPKPHQEARSPRAPPPAHAAAR